MFRRPQTFGHTGTSEFSQQVVMKNKQRQAACSWSTRVHREEIKTIIIINNLSDETQKRSEFVLLGVTATGGQMKHC